MKRYHYLVPATVILSIASLYLEQADIAADWVQLVAGFIDYAILAAVLIELVYEIATSKFPLAYIRGNLFSVGFAMVFVALFAYNKASAGQTSAGQVSLVVVVIRNVFIVLRIYGRFRKLSSYVERLTQHPAQTTLLSFLFVILAGALALMMGFTTTDGRGLSFLDALFTATSAVCVTGLIVVDTATAYTVWGQVVLMALIQIGGLGIMILSYFTVFVVRKRVSLADKLLLSYMLSEDDLSNLSKTLNSIIYVTLAIQAAGAALLFFRFAGDYGFGFRAFFHAVFHAVSAFCNAGFALFSDSLEGYRRDPLVLGTVAGLIILGGLSFAAIVNVRDFVSSRLPPGNGAKRKVALNLNSRTVLTLTAGLIVSGTLLVYVLEHGRSMAGFDLAEQYLSAFFQSVTLRTAGFNSIPFGGLADATYLVMIVFMFVGAASGSTAGGIKVNSVAVIGAHLSSFLRNEPVTTIRKQVIAPERVARAFLILLFGLCAVLVGTFVLSLSEDAPFVRLLFETTSAFGTVGLSTGITADLSSVGKITIIVLMFLGRLGPLTILSAASRKPEGLAPKYPQADLSIG